MLFRSVAAQHPAVYRWGQQGPDPLFFHKVLLGSPTHKLGNRMHSEQTGALFTVFSEAVARLTGEQRSIGAAYFYGFLTHYAMDSSIHPYVYYTQYQSMQRNKKEHPSAIHCRIESDIDSAICMERTGNSVIQMDLNECYKLTDEETAVMAVLLHHLLDKVYDHKD